MATGELAWTVSYGDEVHIATHHEQRTSILTLSSIGDFVRKSDYNLLLVDAVLGSGDLRKQLVMTSPSCVEVLEL